MYHRGIRILLLFWPRLDLVRSFTHASLLDVAFHRDPRRDQRLESLAVRKSVNLSVQLF